MNDGFIDTKERVGKAVSDALVRSIKSSYPDTYDFVVNSLKSLQGFFTDGSEVGEFWKNKYGALTKCNSKYSVVNGHFLLDRFGDYHVISSREQDPLTSCLVSKKSTTNIAGTSIKSEADAIERSIRDQFMKNECPQILKNVKENREELIDNYSDAMYRSDVQKIKDWASGTGQKPAWMVKREMREGLKRDLESKSPCFSALRSTAQEMAEKKIRQNLKSQEVKYEEDFNADPTASAVSGFFTRTCTPIPRNDEVWKNREGIERLAKEVACMITTTQSIRSYWGGKSQGVLQPTVCKECLGVNKSGVECAYCGNPLDSIL